MAQLRWCSLTLPSSGLAFGQPLKSNVRPLPMAKRITAKNLCNSLDGLQGGIATFEEGLSEFLLSVGYPHHYEEIESARPALVRLGLYDFVKNAILESEALVRAGRYREAEMLVLQANRRLSEESGASDDLRRKYKAAND